jgi:hypothetical protein
VTDKSVLLTDRMQRFLHNRRLPFAVRRMGLMAPSVKVFAPMLALVNSRVMNSAKCTSVNGCRWLEEAALGDVYFDDVDNVVTV